MIIEKLNGQRADTIMSGIIVLYQQGLILIASIVFLASIMIPLIKIIALFYLMYSVKFNQTSQKFKTTLAHVIEFIGKWSMLDIYVIAILMAIVNLGFVTKVKTGPASFFFTLVVITTLWASHSFDTRLLWDKKREQDGSSDSNSGA
jgi:paraquat-inducible protein A